MSDQNFRIPTVDTPTILVGHGQTFTYERAHSAIEEYAVSSKPYGNRTIGLSRRDVEDQFEILAEKGYTKK